MKVEIGVSNRHVHLTKEAYDKLFDGKIMEKRNDLKQIGEFASTDTVDILYNGEEIEHVRVLGPFRSKNQIELLGSDAQFLGIDLPVRRSGDLDNTPSVTIKNGDNEIISDGVIRAERHIHVPTNLSEKLGLYERDTVKIKWNGNDFLAKVKVSDNGYFEVHIDKDEALMYGLSNGQEVECEKCLE